MASSLLRIAKSNHSFTTCIAVVEIDQERQLAAVAIGHVDGAVDVAFEALTGVIPVEAKVGKKTCRADAVEDRRNERLDT